MSTLVSEGVPDGSTIHEMRLPLPELLLAMSTCCCEEETLLELRNSECRRSPFEEQEEVEVRSDERRRGLAV